MDRRRGTLEVAVAATLFGTSAVASRLLGAGAPSSIAALRTAAGGLALLVIAAAAGAAPWRHRLRLGPTSMGAGAVLAFQLGYFAAVDRAGAATATMITIGIGPLAAGVIEVLVLRRRPSRRWVAGVAVALVGIACVGGATASVDVVTLVLCTASGACFPIYGDTIRRLTSDRPPLAAAATVFGAAAVPATLVALVVGGAGLDSPGGVALIAYLGVVTIAVAYLLWARGVRHIPLSTAVTVTMLEPITALVLGVLLLGDEPGALGLVGAGAVLAGIALASSRPTSAASTQGADGSSARAVGAARIVDPAAAEDVAPVG